MCKKDLPVVDWMRSYYNKIWKQDFKEGQGPVLSGCSVHHHDELGYFTGQCFLDVQCIIMVSWDISAHDGNHASDDAGLYKIKPSNLKASS